MVNAQQIRPSVALLREIRLLQPLSEAELAQLIPLGASATYEAYANIIIEGELSWGLYLILSGSVGIYKTNKLTGESYDVGQLRAGSFFGEMSLVDEHPRSATVRALSECQLFYISKDTFLHFLSGALDRQVRFYQSCVKTLVGRLRELDDNYVISQYQLWKTALQKNLAMPGEELLRPKIQLEAPTLQASTAEAPTAPGTFAMPRAKPIPIRKKVA